MEPNTKTKTLKIGGMTCVNCEAKIEKKLNRTAGIKNAEVSYSKGTAKVTYDSDMIQISDIVRVIEKLDYTVVIDQEKSNEGFDIGKLLGAVFIIFAIYMIMRRFGLLSLFDIFPEVEADMGYGMLFVIGLLTSVHCVAMCGGINLSQCIPQGVRGKAGDSRFGTLRPSMLYNLGRVISYTVIGGIVGALGSVISFTGGAKGILQIAAGVFMVIMGVNMLNIFPWLRKFNPRMPKIFAKKIHSEKGSNSPLYVGLLNGLMPCGPLQAMQLYALSTGDPIKGASSMFLFSLGTVPLMFGLGALSSLLSQKFTKRVMTIGAVLVVVLGVSMFNNGVALSGFAMVSPSPQANANTNQATVEDNVQIINTSLKNGRYEPITVQAGVPVKWTITAEKGMITGCNNRMFIPEYGIEKKLEYGENVVEFTPAKTGKFTYSCWMGMIRSSITVVEEGEVTSQSNGSADSGVLSAFEPEVPAGYVIPTDEVAVAEIINGVQYVTIGLDDSRFTPSVLVVQKDIETEWTINANVLNEGNSTLLFPDFDMQIALLEGENPLGLFPDADFEFSTIDNRMFGYVKVVEDIQSIDIEAIKSEVSKFETKIRNTSNNGFDDLGSGAGCCN